MRVSLRPVPYIRLSIPSSQSSPRGHRRSISCRGDRCGRTSFPSALRGPIANRPNHHVRHGADAKCALRAQTPALVFLWVVSVLLLGALGAHPIALGYRIERGRKAVDVETLLAVAHE